MLNECGSTSPVGTQRIGTTVCGLLALFLLLAPIPRATAHYVVMGGESAVFNFDAVAAGASPAPPYAAFSVYENTLDWGASDLSSEGTLTFYSELNSSGGNLASMPWSSGNMLQTVDPDILDGRFSIRFALTTGSISVLPTFYGRGSNNVFAIVRGTPVPEPGTLALLGLGLAGLGLSRRRKA